jgi:hypothetical protein
MVFCVQVALGPKNLSLRQELGTWERGRRGGTLETHGQLIFLVVAALLTTGTVIITLITQWIKLVRYILTLVSMVDFILAGPQCRDGCCLERRNI